MISKWLFIHIPKTGGTFFKNALGIGESDSPVPPAAPTTAQLAGLELGFTV